MSFYFPNPNVWAPPQDARLLTVLLPQNETQISTSQHYLELLAQRIAWLIERWMADREASQRQVEQRLSQAVAQISPAQWTPSITDQRGQPLPLYRWRQAWGETIVIHNGSIQERLSQLEIAFPIPVENDEETKEALLWMFRSDPQMEPTLEDWLDNWIYLPDELQ